MSRIGKRIIMLPEKTEITVSGGNLMVKGPLGELSRPLPVNVEVKVSGNEATVHMKKMTAGSSALLGTYASHLTNMVSGVNKLFEKKLILEGIGFKSEVKPARPHDSSGAGGGGKIVLALALGFSHPVEVPISESLKVTTEKNVITISGKDKEEVGQFAARLRALKKPEPYKGKGMRYSDETIRRKQGKKSA